MNSIPPKCERWHAVFAAVFGVLFLVTSAGSGTGTAWAQDEIDYSLEDDFEDITDDGGEGVDDDPLESYNRVMFSINNFFMDYLLKPIAKVYVYAPEVARDGIRNALDNLESPNDLGNDLLQGEFVRAIQVAERAVINTTVGVGGLMDVASGLGIPKHKSDFGQTLAVWGVGEGPYVVLPLFGPSNPRDAIGLAVDSIGDPLSLWANNTDRDEISFGRFGADAVDLYSRSMEDLETIEETSLDFYAAIRSLSRQQRRYQIKYGIYESGPSLREIEDQ